MVAYLLVLQQEFLLLLHSSTERILMPRKNMRKYELELNIRKSTCC